MTSRFLIISVLLVSLSACGAGPKDGVGPTDARGSITVTVTRQRGGPVYVEGAVTVVSLMDGAGHQLEPADGPSKNVRVFEHLPRGDYRLVAGVRPCDANCGQLDPLTDTCSAELPVKTHRVRVELVLTVGSPCQISVHGS